VFAPAEGEGDLPGADRLPESLLKEPGPAGSRPVRTIG
jgi:hypothetical protein